MDAHAIFADSTPRKADELVMTDSNMLFVTTTDGIIQSFSSSALEVFPFPVSDITGYSLIVLLIQIQPHWRPILKQSNLLLDSTSYFLPWTTEPNCIKGMRWQSLLYNNRCFVSLQPALCDRASLAESELDQMQPENLHIPSLLFRLQQAESRWNNSIQYFPGVYFSQRADFSFRFISPTCEKILGIPAGILTRSGSAFIENIHHEDRNRVLQQWLTPQSSRQENLNISYRFRNPVTEQVIYLSDYRNHIYASNGLLLGCEGVFFDSTRQAVAEKRLKNAAWKENLALLNSGLAHDLGNIMTGIYVVAESFRNNSQSFGSLNEDLAMISQSTLEATRIIRRIVELSRDEPNKLQLHNLIRLVEDQLDLIQIILSKRFELQYEPSDLKEIPVHLDDVGLRQLFLNFASNTRDAINGKGKVWIRLQVIDRDQIITPHPEKYQSAEKWAVLTFSDNGPGIPEQLCKKVFDPFFSTKESSKGSGLGLYNARLFCEENGGTIEIGKRPEGGCQITVRIPVLTRNDITCILNQVMEQQCPKPLPSIAYVTYPERSQSDLLYLMKQRNWNIEVVSCCSNTCESASPQNNDILLIDVSMTTLTGTTCFNHVLQTFHNRKKILHVCGMNPDELSPELTDQFDYVIAADQSPRCIINEIEQIWLNKDAIS